jgi:adenylate cyclase class IV
MKEYEHRFKIESRNKIENKISEMGFKKQTTKKQLDLIFEKGELSNFDVFPPGYWMVRVRIESNGKSKLEMKERIDENTWEEYPFEISDPKTQFMFFQKC